MDPHSLSLLEFDRVTAALAACAESAAARRLLARWQPLGERAALEREHARLAEAIAREPEPGAWAFVAEAELEPLISEERREPLDGPGLLAVRAWLDAARALAGAWSEPGARARHPQLAALADEAPDLEPLRARLERCLEPDGRVADAASPELARARRELDKGERELQQRLERWARAFGEASYVTRHNDRFVALVPAAGFPRRRALVHDVSGSGQSLFVEPLEMTEGNNRVIELRALALDEERRVLRELNAAVVDARAPVAHTGEVLVAFDTLRARARWAREAHGTALLPGGDRLRLVRARHPLLALSARRDQVVPLDLELGPEGRLLLVSGPNMGGKTVLLKTVGLSVALAHAGLPVPAAEGSAVPAITEIVVDLGDAQSVEQGLSTFAAHLQRLGIMAEMAAPTTLVLCDELGAGTDPEEGAALGRALLEHVAARGAYGVVTTHLGSLKRVAGEVPGIVNGSLEFDPATLTPRFRFLPGVPGASHALDVAARLGFPDALLARARNLAPAEALALEQLIADLQQARAALDGEREALVRAEAEARAAEAEHREAAEEARRELKRVKQQLTNESEAVLAQSRELWQTIQREARRAERKREDADRVRAAIGGVEGRLQALERDAERALAAAGAAPEPAAPVEVAPGRTVRVKDLGVEAQVVSGPDAEGRVVLRRGSWSIHSHVSRLETPEGPPAAAGAPARGPSGTWQPSEEAPALEVDLRGLEVDEAMRALDQALDRATLAGFGELRIVHGVGKGVLRAVVERHLRGHPQVAAHRMGLGHEGGRGATVAVLR